MVPEKFTDYIDATMMSLEGEETVLRVDDIDNGIVSYYLLPRQIVEALKGALDH